MLTLVAFSSVSNASYIEWVAEQGIDVAATEGAAAKHSLVHTRTDFRREADAIGFALDLPYRAQLDMVRKMAAGDGFEIETNIEKIEVLPLLDPADCLGQIR
jgi:hypothetical protein